MGQFKFEKCLDIEGMYIIEPEIFTDERGYNLVSYNVKDFKEAGLDMEFVQDNYSMSKKGVLRGLHFQKTFQQGKLVRVISGEVFDVVVDIRAGSNTYGKWFGVVLSGEKKNMLYVPKGFAHGFLVLSETAEFSYKLTDYYHPEDEGGILWNDQTIGINWPIPDGMRMIISERDRSHPAFSQDIAL
ncbi:dTDP-4-dehydrorhamnose 3,5-epimerase [Paenibacillus senegalensis]|uniref:dTDP-4-dehydrorhamnose 3,5-epimerase n=1 Tax=Paenibacillus senegalensis TaxID=1465766 RepID=UPI00028A0C39|nr:dTDP-4-dehydrorhamnose 3,5-epimerase [Paenibacillus senegalensis]